MCWSYLHLDHYFYNLTSIKIHTLQTVIPFAVLQMDIRLSKTPNSVVGVLCILYVVIESLELLQFI